MTAVLILAGRELRAGLRNRWAVGASLLLLLLALALAFLGSAPSGAVAASPLAVTVVSLASLSVFLIPLIALLLSYDAIIGEVERGTMLLLLTYPVARWQVVAGKFLGHLAVLGLATLVGYGLAGAILAMLVSDIRAWQPYGAMIASSILLGAAFLALGQLASTVVRERATAAGLAVGLWLVLVVLYDLGLLGLLAATGGQGLSAGLVTGLLIANPSDAYRLFNLSGFGEVSRFAGLAGMADQLAVAPWVALAALAAWVVVPLALAGAVFGRREL
jgi:Cu-processing system permease protein